MIFGSFSLMCEWAAKQFYYCVPKSMHKHVKAADIPYSNAYNDMTI